MEWDKAFHSYLQELDNKKPVITCGDFNVAHSEIDLKNPKTNQKTAGFTLKERESFSSLLSLGFIDIFRHYYPKEENCYTFWSFFRNSRAKGIGWRLDYFLCSTRFSKNVKSICRRERVYGSDHCPLVLTLNPNEK